MLSIRSPEWFCLKDEQGAVTWGASQEWFQTHWQRQAGCGPTCCAHLAWYLAKTRAACTALAPDIEGSQASFTALMERIWAYVTPGTMGVNTTAMFSDGALGYGDDCGVPLTRRVLEIDKKPCCRATPSQLADFLDAAFAADLPVAFLNLSNGSIDHLDSWHWVTLLGFDRDAQTATMIDQGKKCDIDLGQWLKTTLLGGGFVALDAASCACA